MWFLSNLSDLNDRQLALPIDVADLSTLVDPLPLFNYPTNVYGVPWIIGAKKGFPNFNELAMENAFQLTRKLQVTRTSTNASVAPITSYAYNQMFLLEPHQPVGCGMLEFIHQRIHQSR